MSSYPVTYRTGTEIAACNPGEVDSPLPVPFSRSGNFRHIVNSRNGDYVACVSAEGLVVIDLHTNTEMYSFEQKGIIEVSLSPQGTYVCTWERPAKPDPITGEPHHNLVVHNIAIKEIIARHSHKNQGNWAPQWSDDESLYGRLTASSEVTFYVTIGPSAGAAFKLRGATSIADYSVSPGNNPHVVIFIPEDKRLSTPALVQMYSLGNFDVPVSNKTFFKADKVRFLWNHLGTEVLVLTQTDVDTTGQSYYGENNLYYMSITGNWDCRVALDKEGPVHDVAWAPSGREFAVSYGFMPSKTMLFNYKADPVFDFGCAPRNTLVFSPNGRILVIGGFGNLQGDFELWDLSKSIKLASLSSPNATHLSWSPDGRYLLTATLSPRLRVDNGWKLWHYRGVCLAHHTLKELFQIEWRSNGASPPNIDTWARRELSPPPQGMEGIGIPKSKAVGGAYRPPSARGAAGARSILGANFTPPPTSRGRGAPGSGVKGYNNRGVNGRGQSAAAQVAANPAVPGTNLATNEKRVQTLTKKLKQIQGLKVKQAASERLDNAQIRKITSETDIRTELSALGVTQLQF